MRLRIVNESELFNESNNDGSSIEPYSPEYKKLAKEAIDKAAKKLKMHPDKYDCWNLNIETPRHKKLVFTLTDDGDGNFYSVDKYGRTGNNDWDWSEKWEKVLESVSPSDDIYIAYASYTPETLEVIPEAFEKMVRMYKLKVDTWVSRYQQIHYGY